MPAVRADLLRKVGRNDAAREAYLAATQRRSLEPCGGFNAQWAIGGAGRARTQ